MGAMTSDTSRCSTSDPQNSVPDNPTQERPGHRLGWFNLLVLEGGTLVCLGILAFLTFLWAHQSEADDGSSASHVWRVIVSNDWIFQTITLCALALRFIVTTQAATCTSLVASLVFEQRSFPLSCSASLSIHRSVNGGPFRFLGGMLARGSQVWAQLRHIETLLLLILCAGDIGLQFSSTILLSDIGAGPFVDFPRTTCRNITVSFNTPFLARGLAIPPSELAVFGESQKSSSATPNAFGLSDTGVVTHAMLPMAANRTSIRRYHGPAYVVRSRAACMAPRMQSLDISPEYFQYRPGDNSSSTYVTIAVTGTVNFRDTLEDAGVFLSSDFDPVRCPSWFNCTQSYEGFPSLCIFQKDQPEIPEEMWQGTGFWSTGWDWDAADPWMSNPEIYLVYHTDDYRETGADFPSPHTPNTPGNEWETYPMENTTGRNLKVSLCFHNWNISLEEVVLKTEKNLQEKSWGLQNLFEHNTDAATFLGVDPERQSAGQRGTLDIEHVRRLENHTFAWESGLNVGSLIMAAQIPSSFSGFPITTYSATIGLCSDCEQYQWAIEYISLWANLIAFTERPAAALQVMKLLSAQAIHDQTLPSFRAEPQCEPAEEVIVVWRSRPAGSFGGLAAVVSLYVISAFCVGIVAVLYTRRTRFSHVDNFWHAVSQVVAGYMGNGTVARDALLFGANATDDEVTQRLLENRGDFLVQLCPSGEMGYVGVTRADADADADA